MPSESEGLGGTRSVHGPALPSTYHMATYPFAYVSERRGAPSRAVRYLAVRIASLIASLKSVARCWLMTCLAFAP